LRLFPSATMPALPRPPSPRRAGGRWVGDRRWTRKINRPPNRTARLATGKQMPICWPICSGNVPRTERHSVGLRCCLLSWGILAWAKLSRRILIGQVLLTFVLPLATCVLSALFFRYAQQNCGGSSETLYLASKTRLWGMLWVQPQKSVGVP